jgi:hypothetical protein
MRVSECVALRCSAPRRSKLGSQRASEVDLSVSEICNHLLSGTPLTAKKASKTKSAVDEEGSLRKRRASDGQCPVRITSRLLIRPFCSLNVSRFTVKEAI